MTATIEHDTDDSRRLLTAEAKQAYADQIRELHKASEERKAALGRDIADVCEEAISIAKIVESVHATIGGKQFILWWRDMALPVGWAERYLKLARTEGRDALGDKDQLRLIGVLPEAETRPEGQQHARATDAFAWVRYSGKLAASLTVEQARQMNAVDRKMALSRLAPIREAIDVLLQAEGQAKL